MNKLTTLSIKLNDEYIEYTMENIDISKLLLIIDALNYIADEFIYSN